MSAGTLLGDAPLLTDDPATVAGALRREGWTVGPSCGTQMIVARDPNLAHGVWASWPDAQWLLVDCAASNLFVVHVKNLDALCGLVLTRVGPDLTRLSRSPSGGWTAWWSSPDGITSADLQLPPGVTAPRKQLAFAPPSPGPPPGGRRQPQPRGRHTWVLPLVPARPLPRRVLDQLVTTTGRRTR
jgi:hypothetical protein